ncbi:hypothetical protein L7F22_019720 [Adiantum nelumboides]|nr:hypothetical protein [Adiantum nelumboides]
MANWFVHDGERGSGKRVLLWHAHGGGEGMDDDIIFALKNVSPLRSSFENAFTSSFTLWIDPGCVAIRFGQGPGTFVGANHIPSTNSIKTLYGTLPTSALPVIQAMTPAPPKLTLLPSTPALDTNEADTTATFGNQQTSKHSLTNSLLHYRSPSWSSSSQNEHLLDGHRTASSGSEGEGSEACPSLVAASSTRGDSDSELFDEGDEDDETDSELSIQDMIDRGGFKNFDIIDDDDEEEVGDETVQHITVTKNAPSIKSPSKAISVTSYDGGNVGVLGGGVRLGASKPSAPLQHKTSTNALRAKQAAAPVWHPSQQQFTNNQSPALSPSNLPNGNAAAWSPYSPNMGMYSPSINTSGCPSPQYVIVDGVAIPIASPHLKRGRARGRRSRGRGAGRAARRQAAAAAAAGKSQEELYGWSPLDEASSASSALGITLNSTTTNVPDLESEERLMAMVRQRADQVAKDLVRRHLEQQKQQQQQQQHYTPRQSSTSTFANSQQPFYQHHQPQAFLPAHMMTHIQPQRHQMSNFSPISHNAQWIH